MDLVPNPAQQCDEERPKCRAWYVNPGAIEVVRTTRLEQER